VIFFLADSLTGAVAEIRMGQLVNSQPLNSNATMNHLTGSQDKISDSSLSRPASSIDQETPQPLLKNSDLTKPSNSKFDKHTTAESSPDKPVTSGIALPFEKNSPLWKNLETILEVFSHVPQTPHFIKLERYCLCQAGMI
jgi:Protein of unknown function (DUF724)